MNKFLPLFCFLFFLITTFPAYSQHKIPFTVLHTNDEHSHLVPHPAIDYHPERPNSTVGGFARLGGAIRQIREQKEYVNEPVLTFSAGDHLGGPAFGWLPLKDGLAPELNLFRQLGYDAVTIGNHEFDYGPNVYANYLSAAGYPDELGLTAVLGSNIRPPENHPLHLMNIHTHTMVELAPGVKAGVFGLIGNDAINKTADPGDVEFDDPYETAEKIVNLLEEEGADIIIAVTHSGVPEDRVLAQKVPGIHLIVGGHTHTPLHEPITEGSTIIVQAGSYLEYLGIIELEWNTETELLSIRNHKNEQPFLIELNDNSPVDLSIADKISEYRNLLTDWVLQLTDSTVTDLAMPVAASDFAIRRNEPQRESAIGNYITDALRMAAERATGKPVDVAVQANGAIRAEIIPGQEEWSEGLISFYDLVMATGLGAGRDGNPGYPVVSFYLTEDEVRHALEVSVLLSELLGDNYFLQFSGLQMAFDPKRAVLFTIPFSGTPIPTSRAVLSAERTLRDGRSVPLQKGSDTLMHVVTDRYIAGFLPLVGDVVPSLSITIKDENGQPLDLDSSVIMTNGEELKVWKAVLDYTLSHDVGEKGLPAIPAYYESTQNRQRVVHTLPLWIWPAAIIILIAAGVFYYMRRN